MYRFSLITLVLLLIIALPGSAVQAASFEAGNSVTATSPTSSVDTTTVPADSSAVIADPGGIKPVTPTQFVAKVNNVIAGINTATSGLILPIATFAILISIIIIIMGALVGHHNLVRYGWGGFFLVCFGLFLFWGLPVLFGLIQGLVTRFISG